MMVQVRCIKQGLNNINKCLNYCIIIIAHDPLICLDYINIYANIYKYIEII